MGSLVAPDLSRPSFVADYVELLAMGSKRPRGLPDIEGIFRVQEDDRRSLLDDMRVAAKEPSSSADSLEAQEGADVEAEEVVVAPSLESEEETLEDSQDEEISGERQDYILDQAECELDRRREILSDLYPFDRTRDGWTLSAGPSLGSRVYLLCLILSAHKHNMLSLTGAPKAPAVVDRMFQACATVAAGGALGGASAWIGFPRPEGNSFLEAIQKIFEQRIGVGICKRSVPPGLPAKVKDDGVDVFAWRSWPDRHFGAFILAGQVATGATNWDDKSVIVTLQSFGQWLEIEPAQSFIPALFVPWPAYHEAEASPSTSFEETLWNSVERLGRQNGYVVDRLRIAASVHTAAGMERDHVDGWAELEAALNWADQVVVWLQGTQP